MKEHRLRFGFKTARLRMSTIIPRVMLAGVTAVAMLSIPDPASAQEPRRASPAAATADWPPEGQAPRTADGKPDLSGNWQPNAIRQNVDLIGSGADVPLLPRAAAIYKQHKTWLDESGIPHSTEMKVTERIRRLDYGHLEIEHIIDDPKTFARPWSFTTHPSLLRGELIEYICQENNKDVEHLVGK
jgi:hypothetical protein